MMRFGDEEIRWRTRSNPDEGEEEEREGDGTRAPNLGTVDCRRKGRTKGLYTERRVRNLSIARCCFIWA